MIHGVGLAAAGIRPCSKYELPRTMNVFTFFRRINCVCIAILVPSMMTSCELSPLSESAAGAVADQRGEAAAESFRKDQRKTIGQGTGLGAGLGALAGGIIGHQSGRGVEGALIGAAAGGVLGNVYGRHVAAKKALATLSDVNLDACIAAAAQQNRAVRNKSAALRKELSGLRAQVARAKAAGDKNSLNAARSRLKSMQKEADASISEVNGEITEQKKVSQKLSGSSLSGQYSKRLNSGISSMSGARSEMESTRTQIASTLTSF